MATGEEVTASHNCRTVLITGASTGIGRACAVHLARQGMHVFAGVRREDDAQSIRNEEIQKLRPLIIDVTDSASITEAVAELNAHCNESGLFGLVNNAGVAVAGPQECLDIRDWRRVFDVNFFGAVELTRALLPLLRKAAGARIVNVSSSYGALSVPFLGPYCASKHALESISRVLRLELHGSSILVCLVAPSDVQTPIWEKGERGMIDVMAGLSDEQRSRYGRQLSNLSERTVEAGRRGLPPERVARAVERALTARRPRVRYCVGALARWCELAGRFLPPRALEWAIRRYIASKT